MIPPERLAELAQGALPSAEESADIDGDPAIQAELAALDSELGELLLALTPVPPPRLLRERLLAETLDPWWRALGVFSKICDISVERLKEYVHAARTTPWQFWPDAGVELFHLEAGPAVAGADVGFVRAPPFHFFPDHRHLGGERAVILFGSMNLGGTVLVTGQMDVRGPESEHNWTAGPEGVVFAVVVTEGVMLLSGGKGPTEV